MMLCNARTTRTALYIHSYVVYVIRAQEIVSHLGEYVIHQGRTNLGGKVFFFRKSCAMGIGGDVECSPFRKFVESTIVEKRGDKKVPLFLPDRRQEQKTEFPVELRSRSPSGNNKRDERSEALIHYYYYYWPLSHIKERSAELIVHCCSC